MALSRHRRNTCTSCRLLVRSRSATRRGSWTHGSGTKIHSQKWNESKVARDRWVCSCICRWSSRQHPVKIVKDQASVRDSADVRAGVVLSEVLSLQDLVTKHIFSAVQLIFFSNPSARNPFTTTTPAHCLTANLHRGHLGRFRRGGSAGPSSQVESRYENSPRRLSCDPRQTHLSCQACRGRLGQAAVTAHSM